MAELDSNWMGVAYVLIAFILVSLDNTYGITYNLFGNLLGSNSQVEYGMGNTFAHKGFILHIIVFAILIILPMVLIKK